MKTIVILTHVMFDNSPYCIFVHEHAKALKKEGYNVIVFAMLSWFPFINFFRKNRKTHYKEKKGTKIIDGVTVIYKKMLGFSNILADSKINLNGLSYYWSVKRKIKNISKNEEILFIDAHMFKDEGYVAALLHRKLGYKTTVTCHGTSLIKSTQYRNSDYIVSNIMNNVDYAICVSPFLQNKLKRFNYSNTKVIYNGINFYPTEKKEDKREITILTAGAFAKRKNIDLVIRAFKQVNEKFPDTNLAIIGQGEEKENLRRIVQEINIGEKVNFIGQVKNKEVHQIMKKSKIFLLPSVNEGFGIVYAEAMSNGCITIGTKKEGIDGFIIDGVNGFLVEPEVNEIVKRVNYILENETKLKNIIQQGKNDSQKLTWENNAKEYIKLFETEI